MANIGYATLAIIPSFAGIQAKLTAGIAGPAAAAGLAAGRQAGSGFNSGLASATGRASQVGASMSRAISLPVLGIGAAALSMGANFEHAMNGVKAVTGSTGPEFTQLESLARDMGATTAFSATEAANAMEFLGMAGFSTKDILSSLPDVLNLAAAGNTDLATTADIASNIMSGFGIEASESARVADVLAQTMRSTNVDLGMLGESMKYAAPLAQAAGWSFEEAAAAVGFLGNAGIQGSDAGTGLNSILATLSDTASTGGKRLAEFGVAAQDADGQVRPLTDILADMAAKGADVSDVISIFGLEAGPKLQALMGQGSEGIKDLIADLEGADGAAQEMADTRMDGAVGGFKGLQSAVESLGIEIANSGLLEWATSAVTALTEFTRSLGETNPEVLKWGTIIAGVIAVGGPLLFVVAKIASGVATVGGAAIGAVKGTAQFTSGLIKGSAALGENASAASRAGAGIRTAGAAIGRGIGTAASAAANLTRLAGSYLLVGTRAAGAAAKTAVFKLGSLAASAATAAASLTRLAGAYLLTGLRAAGAAAKLVLFKAAQLAIKAATIAWTAVQWLLNVALNANPIGLIVLAIAALVAGFIWAYSESETFRNIVNGVLSAVGAFFVWIWENAIKPLWDGLVWLFNWVVENWQMILGFLTGPIGIAVMLIIEYWDQIKAWFQAGVDFVVGAVEWGIGLVLDYWNWLASIPGMVADWFGQAYDWAVDKLSNLVDWVSGIPGDIGDGLSNLYSEFTAPFKSAFNAVAGLWNDTIGSWSISIPDWVPEIGGGTWSMPKIPMLAKGGVVPATPGGTLAVIGEGAEDEAVLPLSKLDAMLAARPAGGGGTTIEAVNVHAWSDRFDLDQVQRELAENGAV